MEHLLPSNILVSEKEAAWFRYSVGDLTILVLQFFCNHKNQILNLIGNIYNF